MKQITILIILLSVLVFNCSRLYGNPNYTFKHYNINNGLSQNTVFSIFQDKQGFMWFATKDGLNRFDGSSFKVFRFSSDDRSENSIFHQVLQDKHDQIWVGTDDGVYIYNPEKDSFKHLDEVSGNGGPIDGIVSDMMVDMDGDIWISIERKGVYCYNLSDGKLDFFDIQLGAEGMKKISICQDREGYICVFPYSRPMIRIDKTSKQESEFILNDDKRLFEDIGVVTTALSNQYNQLIIGTSEKGLIQINIIDKTYRTLIEKDSFGMPIHVRAIEWIDDHTLWVGTETGIYIYDTKSGEVTVNLRHHYSIPYSLSDNAIYSIYKDRDGGIWVGSYFGGVDYYSEHLNKFELFYPIPGINDMKGIRVREICPAFDDMLWIGTEDGGLNLFNPATNSFLPLPEPLRALYPNIHALYQDRDYLWIGTFSKGLQRFNLKTNELKTYRPSKIPNSISQNSPFAICKDRQNSLWIATLLGLDIYNYQTDNFTKVEELKGVSIYDIVEDSGGKIWISTFSNGLYRFDPANEDWKSFTNNPGDSTTLPNNRVTSVFEDSKSRLWIATQGGGFCLFNRDNETFTTFNTTRGMPNNVVYHIKEDNEGNLWLSTNSGLVCFDPKKTVFKNYTVRNGLKTNQFNYKSSFKAKDGTLYFGSVDGFVRFNPFNFKEVKRQIPIMLTDLFIDNDPVSPIDKNSPLKQSISYTNLLVLPYNKNSINLRYALLDYSNEDVSYVFYKLEGFDKEWIDTKGGQNIVYSNLEPGKYQLVIKLNDHTSKEQTNSVKILAIHIKPPFWLSDWAYGVYVIFLLSMVWALFRYLNWRSQRIHRRKMYIFEQEKERELYRTKIDFFTNVAHEIRTPLSLIKAPLDHVILTEDASETIKENLQIMSRNTERLLLLTNQLLDFRKTESDAYRLNLETQNVSDLIRDTFTSFIPMAKQHHLTFELDLPDIDMFVCLDKEAFLKIITNLLHNALKYCESFARLRAYISTEEEKDTFYLLIENDGERIPEAQKENIFKPFVQLDKKNNQKIVGTGIGLAFSLSLAILHKGNLILEDTADLICFCLTLPVGEVKEIIPEPVQKSGKEKKKKIDENISFSSILLVDDDVELLQFEEKFLSSHYHVLAAESGKQALDILRKENVNLIVCDVMMPEMDGFELTKRIKSDIEFSHIPIILLTAKVNVESKVQGFKMGADAYIEKPFSLEILMAQIVSLLQSRELLYERYQKYPFSSVNSLEHNKADEEFIKKLHQIVHENIDDNNFIIEDIAEQFNMSRASFYRKIKGVLNLTLNDYIRMERLKKAAQLLKEGNYRINEICYMVGFNNPSYFAKCFHQQFGVLPKDFV